ncbi:hypothetical protein [Mycobacterium sp. C31M]
MRLIAEAGLWRTDTPVPDPPAVAVLEVAGAVLAWTVDDPSAPVQLTVTDIEAADWLWRVTGPAGHVAMVEAVSGIPVHGSIDIPDLQLDVQALAPLRRLAVGHWLRRWWPASLGDSIVDLDAAVLDAEIAMLTAATQEFFAEDTLDSDIDSLLQPHRDTLLGYRRDGDPRVAELAAACADLADWPTAADDAVPAQRRRDDYALAAGAAETAATGAIAGGATSISWSAVPPAVFDAAEDTVDWSVRTVPGGNVVATVRAAVSAPAGGIAVRLRSGAVAAEGVLAADGTATLTLPVSESAAWNHDWSNTTVAIGAGKGEDRAARDRVRAFARARLGGTADTFLAEVLAAESDY